LKVWWYKYKYIHILCTKKIIHKILLLKRKEKDKADVKVGYMYKNQIFLPVLNYFIFFFKSKLFCDFSYEVITIIYNNNVPPPIGGATCIMQKYMIVGNGCT